MNNDSLGEPSTGRPAWSIDDTRPAVPAIRQFGPPPGRIGQRLRQGCMTLLLAGAILALIYFLLPVRTNVLILGTDSRETDNPLGRTDTIILTTIVPFRPDVAMLSIPRDLWVSIPGYGENRINAAYFFAEAEAPGTGAQATVRTLQDAFGVEMDYTILVDFSGVVHLVDAMGGIDIEFPGAMSGYEAGLQHLDGTRALAFVRDREGSDDFFRMERGQLFIRAVVGAALRPANWLRFPAVAAAMPGTLSTDLPFWHWPRLALAVLRAGPEGIDGHTIDREMAAPTITAAGASVLLPDWEQINPLIKEVFP